MNRKVQLAFGSAILILLVVGAVSYRSIVMSSESNRWVWHTHQVLENLQKLVSGMATVESSDRGFALTGEESYLDLYRAKCAEHGTEPDIVWIHACYIDEDRDTARREAESVMRGFLKGNASVLLEHADELAAKDRLEASGYGFYSSGIMEELSDMPYEQMIAGDVVWVGTPADVIERIEAVREICDGLTEVSITVNPGGAEHWQAIKQQELFARTVMPHFRAQHLAEAKVV